MTMQNMTNQEKREYLDRIDRVCESLGISEADYKTFRKYGVTLHRYYEYDCNGVDGNGNAWTDERAEKYEGKWEQYLTKKAQALGLYIYFQTDPRGATVYLDKNPIDSMNYDRAIVIY